MHVSSPMFLFINFLVIGGERFATEKRTSTGGFCASGMDTGCDAMVKGGVRSVRLQSVKRSDGTVSGRDNVDTLKTVSTKEYQSAIAKHLSLNN